MVSFIASFTTFGKSGSPIKKINCPPPGGLIATGGGNYPLVYHEKHLKVALQWERLESGLVEVFAWAKFPADNGITHCKIEDVKGEV